MSYLDYIEGKVALSQFAKGQYVSSPLFSKDALISDFMRMLGFNDNRTRWHSMIVWTHKSQEIEVSVERPQGKSWDQDPYADPQSKSAFLHEQAFTVKLIQSEYAVEVEPNEDNTHWLTLTESIRELWEKA
jgi:hypothetical protein